MRTGADLTPLLRLKVEIGILGDRLATLRQQRPQLSARLAAWLALPPSDVLPWPEWEPPAMPTPPDAAALLAAMDATNPELLMLERKIGSARARAELTRLESRPDFTVGVTYIQIGDPVVNPTTPDAGRDPWSVTLAVNLPIWNGRTLATQREAGALQRSAESELTDRRNQLHADATIALAALQDAHRRIGLYAEDLLPLARQALENTRASYSNNRASLLELIDSERSQLDLDLQLWRAHTDAAQQLIALQTLANQPL